MMMVQHHESDYLLQLRDDRSTGSMPRARSAPKFMAIAIHPYISGQPHRIKYLERSTTSTSTTACCTGTANRSSTGTAALPKIGAAA